MASLPEESVSVSSVSLLITKCRVSVLLAASQL